MTSPYVDAIGAELAEELDRSATYEGKIRLLRRVMYETTAALTAQIVELEQRWALSRAAIGDHYDAKSAARAADRLGR